MRTSFTLSAALVGVSSGVAGAGPVEIQYATPTLDRWVYPFGATPGLEAEARVFAALGVAGFDDRDGQFLVGYGTAGQITPGRGSENYFVSRARLRIRTSQADRFVYDPTFDSYVTSLPAGHPGAVPDSDAGKPIELFGAGYRNGFTAATFCETCPFGGPPLVPPAERARNVFAAIFDAQGVATDASRNVRLEFEAPPLAIGQTSVVAPGAMVPANAEFVFDINLCANGGREYIQRALDQGMLHLVATTLLPVSGPGATDFPWLYTRENPLAQSLGYEARLELVVTQGKQSDFNNDGVLNVADFGAFQTGFVAGNPGADLNQDCALTVADFGAFQTLFVLGR